MQLVNSSKIPILNLYYLLCYAWNRLDEKEIVSAQPLEMQHMVDLLGNVLVNGVSYLLRKGLDRGYLPISEETGTIRGRINFQTTLRKNMLKQPKLICEYDELSYNVIHNRILKTTLRSLILCKDVDRNILDKMTFLYRRMKDIETIELSGQCFKRVQIHRNNHFYGFLMNICELVYNNLLVSETTGKSRFQDFLRDERQMSVLFEEFVRNFYHKEQSLFAVKREVINWNLLPLNEASAAVLPVMRTDISLIGSGRKIIIDTKYYQEAMGLHYDKMKIRSANLYQLHAYLTNLEVKGAENTRCEGILLYPTTTYEMDYVYTMGKHRISVKTINLNQDWRKIHEDLIEVIN
jgi:5-methylcytosine-specific restriction enzyme subunit McrC